MNILLINYNKTITSGLNQLYIKVSVFQENFDQKNEQIAERSFFYKLLKQLYITENFCKLVSSSWCKSEEAYQVRLISQANQERLIRLF